MIVGCVLIRDTELSDTRAVGKGMSANPRQSIGQVIAVDRGDAAVGKGKRPNHSQSGRQVERINAPAAVKRIPPIVPRVSGR